MSREYPSINESARSRLLTLEEKRIRNFRRLIVVGDLHGDYQSLHSVLNVSDPTKDGIIFLGDYADRGWNEGMSGAKVIETVDALMKKHPRNVFCLQGNHEDYPESGMPDWGPNELREKEIPESKWPSYFQNKLKPFIRRLYLAAIVPGEILFVHGGISNKVGSLKDLEHPTTGVEEDVLWSDPFEGNGDPPNPRGLGVQFGIDVTMKICKQLDVKRIVRSHQPYNVMIAGGPYYSHEGSVLTTSTTTSYGPGYEPFILTISADDFSLKCDQILPDGSSARAIRR